MASVAKGTSYKVKDGDSLASIASANGITWQQLAKFNFGTEDPVEINKYLRGRLGCTKKTDDGKNYKFSSTDDPGILHIPAKDHDKTYTSNTTHTVVVKKPIVKIIDPALVNSRFFPKPDWKGEFGCDWMREGLSGIVGDVKYSSIVGKYPLKKDPDNDDDPSIAMISKDTEYAKLKAEYSPFTIDGIVISGAPAPYFTTFLHLFPADECPGKTNTAKIIAKVKVISGVPEALKFRFSTPDYKDYIDIDKEELPKATGSYEITIKSKKASASDILIELINHTNDKLGKAEEKVVGKLILLKNNAASRKHAKVVFVPMVTNIGGTVKTFPNGSTNNEITFLEKYLNQALVQVTSKIIKLDVTVQKSMFNTIKKMVGLGPAADFNKDWVTTDDAGNPVVANYQKNWTSIHGFLEKKFNDLNPAYADWYKVFFFDEPGGYWNNTNYIGLNGAAKDIPSKCVVLFNTHNTSTTTHELLHAMGLYHTFSNSGKFTYKKGEVENIMDYSHQPSYGSKNRISTWKWQWDQLSGVF